MRNSILIQALLAVVLMGGLNTASSTSFALSPIRLNLAAGHAIDAITVTNQGKEAVVVQLETMVWSQSDGRDVYNPTRELIATPPIFTVPPDGVQVVRIGLRRPADPRRELAYRVYFQEVPSPPRPGFQGLQMALRLGVPVFVAPPSGVHPQPLRWKITVLSSDVLAVRAFNDGNTVVRVKELKLIEAEGAKRILAREKLASAVLAGSSLEWRVKLGMPFKNGRVHLMINEGEGETDGGIIPVAPQ